jgi:hypothetical protein
MSETEAEAEPVAVVFVDGEPQPASPAFLASLPAALPAPGRTFNAADRTFAGEAPWQSLTASQ